MSLQYQTDIVSGKYYKTHRTVEAVMISKRLNINEALEELEKRGFKPFIIEPTENWWRFYQYQPAFGPHIKRYWIDVNDDVKYTKVLYRI
jgi:hypothetical protein